MKNIFPSRSRAMPYNVQFIKFRLKFQLKKKKNIWIISNIEVFPNYFYCSNEIFKLERIQFLTHTHTHTKREESKMKNVLFKPKIKFLRGDNPPRQKRRKLKEENDLTGLPVRRIFYKCPISLFSKSVENTFLKASVDL